MSAADLPMNGLKDGELEVGVCQMTSIDSIEANVESTFSLLKNFEKDKVDLVSFPENSLYFRIQRVEKIVGLTEKDPIFTRFSDWAKKHETVIHLGSVPLRRSAEKIDNATIWFDKTGKMHIPYVKIHLFDVDVEGEKPVRESDNFSYGEHPGIMQIGSWKFGLSICYDLRFSNLYLHYAKEEVDAILIPAAFLVATGQAHWHILMRARAIESQCYVIAAAQSGKHKSSSGEERATFGHSLVVAPWGEIVAEAKDQGPQVLRYKLSKTAIAKVRRQIPMRGHRKEIPTLGSRK